MLSNLKCFEIYILTNILHQQPKIKLIIYYNVPDVRKMKEVAANIDFSDINGSAVPGDQGVGPVIIHSSNYLHSKNCEN